MRYSKGERTKEKILKSTLELAAQEGFTSVSYQQIADAVSLSQAAVLKHFPSKDILFTEVRREASISNQIWVGPKVEARESGYEKILEYCFQTCIWILKEPSKAQVLLLGYYVSSHSEDMRKENLRAWKHAEQKIETYLCQHYSDTEKNPELIQHQVRCIHSWVTGLAIRVFVEGKRSWTKTKLRQSIEAQLQFILKT